ncbi:MAG: sulfite exporter TauE/SafE family protein [bacterium]|nr:sulfite exporter TauE/SafE family protein [bacterium]
MTTGDRWGLFRENWFMSVTMAFGSFIAGATSEGGGAVAFPVMTLLFGIVPSTARDFSLMIQTVGMIAAGLTILSTRIPVERHALVWASLGGGIGVILGIEFVAGHLSPPFAKMLFTSTWLAFAFALILINRYRDREVHVRITNFLPRHAVLLVVTGIAGGVVTSITGSGLDIATFALLVLRLRINESIATPTSVVLMGVNAAVGFAWKGTFGAGMAPAAWNYWWVCVPIVVVGAPFGAWFIKHRSRLFVAKLLYASIVIQFFAAILIVPMTPQLVGFSVLVFVAGLLFFRWMANRGVRRLGWLSDQGLTEVSPAGEAPSG